MSRHTEVRDMHDAANCGRGYMIAHPRRGLPHPPAAPFALLAVEGTKSCTLDAD